MADNPTVVTINDTEYYAPSDYIDNIIVVNNRLVNTGASTIYLYADFREYGNNYTGYPRITCPSNTYCYLTSSYNSNYQTLTVNKYEIKNRNFSDLFLISTVIVGLLAILIFKRR